MRVLHLYAGNLYGGIERLLVTLASERDICPAMEPSFALCFEGRLAAELRETGAAVHLLPQVRFSRPWSIARARRALRELLRREHFDVAVTHAAWPHTAFAPAVASEKVPLAFWAHDVPTGTHWIERWAKRTRPNLVLANSRFTAAAMPVLFPDIRCELQYGPVSLSPPIDHAGARRELRDELCAPADAIVIVITSRWEQWKGHELLLAGLELLPDDLPRWECWIAGAAQRPQEEEYGRTLRATAERLSVRGRVVRFIGARNDIPRVLATADTHCQPNTGPEPFGIAFVEALHAGLPVVTTNIGAAREIVEDGVCGILVPPENPAALAATLQRLIAAPELRRALGAAGPARAKALCDPAVMLPALHQKLATIAASRRTR